jgi:sugar phosphate permease
MSRYRWVILGSGTLAQASFSAIILGLAVLAPALRSRYDLTLTQLGIVLGTQLAGSVVSLLAWGVLADRIGERVVIATGLTGCGLLLVGASSTERFGTLAPMLFLAGVSGSAVNAASGRAVLHWFGPEDRGLALGIRQTAVPIGGAAASLGLPHLHSARAGLIALGIGCVSTALLAAVLLREGERPLETTSPRALEPLRDRRMWTLCWGSSLLLAPQICLVGFTVVFLHDRRHVAAASAAWVLAAIQLLGIAARIGAGRWSDLVRSRLVPLRRIALASATLSGIVTVLTGAPLVLLVPAIVLAGTVGMSWNGLSFAAAAEAAGYSRSGAALGFQQTVLAIVGASLPPLFAAVVGAASWRLGFGLVALLPLAGFAVLTRVRE